MGSKQSETGSVNADSRALTSESQLTKSSPRQRITVVCGAGVVGVTTAYYLSELGHKVIVVDAESGPGQVTSFRNGALICPSLTTPWANSAVALKAAKSVVQGLLPSSAVSSQQAVVKVHPSAFADKSFWRFAFHYLRQCTTANTLKNTESLHMLASYSRLCLNEIVSKQGKPIPTSTSSSTPTSKLSPSLDFYASALGTLQLASSSSQMTALSTAAAALQQRGGRCQVLHHAQDCTKVEPALEPVAQRIAGGVFSDMDTNGDIHKYCQDLMKVCQRQGVEFHFGQRVETLLTEGKRVTGLLTSEGVRYCGDAVVLATAHDTNRLLATAGSAVPMYPVKGYVVEVPFKEGHVVPRVNMVDDADKLYLSPLRRTLRISGLAEFVPIQVDKQESPNPSVRGSFLLSRASAWLPGVLDLDRASYSHCYRPLSPDDVPMVGRISSSDNLFLNTGHGSKGWTLAFGSAKLCAHLVHGFKPEIDPSRFDPARFD